MQTQENTINNIQLPVKSGQRRALNGVLIFNKNKGTTSNKILQKVRYLFRAKKAGHTGSLDPLASGVLPICFGEATKFSQFLLDEDKHYKVTAKLGIVTDTSDADGNIVASYDVPELSTDQVQLVLEKYKGEIFQVPSMYSAIKYNGKPLYEYARKGIEVQRKSRKINVYSMELISKSFDEITLKVKCSKGTYIRTLIEDIGKDLGCGAHVVKLERLLVGPFSLDKSVSLSDLENTWKKNINLNGPNQELDITDLDEVFSELDSYLLSIDSILYDLDRVDLPQASSFYFLRGNPVFVNKSNIKTGKKIAVFCKDSQRFLGVGEMLDDGKIAPRRLING